MTFEATLEPASSARSLLGKLRSLVPICGRDRCHTGLVEQFLNRPAVPGGQDFSIVTD